MVKFVFQGWLGSGLSSTPLGKSRSHHGERKQSSAKFDGSLDAGDFSYPR